jgi:hypothetical protein
MTAAILHLFSLPHVNMRTIAGLAAKASPIYLKESI